MTSLAAAACRERDSEADDAKIAERGEIIGLGALKFMLLKFNAKTTIMFDPAASIRFEGDTGPYVQYVCARIKSIKRKAADRNFSGDVDWSLLDKKEEKDLASLCAMYGSVLKNAAGKKDCSPLVEYLLNVAKAFNRFYRECPILSDKTPAELAKARLHLAQCCRELLIDGLETLTISVPDAM